VEKVVLQVVVVMIALVMGMMVVVSLQMELQELVGLFAFVRALRIEERGKYLVVRFVSLTRKDSGS
jgi:hypothetical protein